MQRWWWLFVTCVSGEMYISGNLTCMGENQWSCELWSNQSDVCKNECEKRWKIQEGENCWDMWVMSNNVNGKLSVMLHVERCKEQVMISVKDNNELLGVMVILYGLGVMVNCAISRVIDMCGVLLYVLCDICRGGELKE